MNAKTLALRVQRSARNKRKDEVREYREDMAEGFHTDDCLDELFKIQQGRCYYSGELLVKNPNNFSKDHSEMYSLLRETFNELARSEPDTHQRRNALASIENI